jgi:ATP-dependent Clp protease adapter protein ClpS
MANVALSPHVIDSASGVGRWMVLIYNNEVNTIEEVIEILMRSTGCGNQEAYIETWEAHTYGKSEVHFADRSECEVVAHMIGSIGVQTEVRREWEADSE